MEEKHHRHHHHKKDKESSGKEEMVFSRKEGEKVTMDDFKMLEVVGKGSFGKVILVQMKGTDKIYAMKILSKSTVVQRKQVTHTKAEKNILQQIQHPFIIKLHYAFQTPTKLHLVMDYINGGELFFHLKNEGCFSAERVRFYAAEISLALKHLHSLDIVYRDLKPENILIGRDGHIVLTDFGLSKELKDTDNTKTFCGTPEYLAPEILKGVGHGTPVDMWSLGTLTYEMLTGLPPFYDTNVNQMYQLILSGTISWTEEIPEEAKSFIAGCLERDPAKRLTAADAYKCEWFLDLDFDLLLQKKITPPWIPPVASSTDTSMVDPEFTEEPVDMTPEAHNPVNDAFDGFTYTESTNLE